MKFVLLGINVALFVLIGIYLADIFAIKSAGTEAIAFLFAATVAALLVANEFIEEYKIDNVPIYLAPALIVIGAPFLVGRSGLAILAGILLAIPGLVLLIRKLIK